MSTHIDWVDALKEFHEAFDLKMSNSPDTLYVDQRTEMLRVKLMISELSELVDAMANEDLVEIADGIADLLYVVIGTGITYGIPMKKVFDQVHANNMTKVGPDGYAIKDASGKVQKPDDYKPVDLSWILDM